MLDQAFADIGLAFSQAFGGPYHDGRVIEIADTEYDDGGSIITPGGPVYRGCSVQIDTVTQRMREAAGYTDKDVAFIVLAATLEGSLGTEARVEVLAGPHVGIWSVELIERDTVAAGWVGRGRQA